jgi:ribosomal protein L36
MSMMTEVDDTWPNELISLGEQGELLIQLAPDGNHYYMPVAKARELLRELPAWLEREDVQALEKEEAAAEFLWLQGLHPFQCTSKNGIVDQVYADYCTIANFRRLDQIVRRNGIVFVMVAARSHEEAREKAQALFRKEAV